MHRPFVRLRLSAVAGVAATLLTACATQPVTADGEQVKALYDIFLVAAAVVFVVVAGIIGSSILRDRDRGDARGTSGLHENVRLELLWWAIPTVLVIVLFILTAQLLGAVEGRTVIPALSVTVAVCR